MSERIVHELFGTGRARVWPEGSRAGRSTEDGEGMRLTAAALCIGLATCATAQETKIVGIGAGDPGPISPPSHEDHRPP
ncbi:hypothetical protein, partial [Methylobacterium sp. sgz302542]|uniref:hypothetical protein n=1 Tax=Methylobacterium sp. sgz302542 TaxID=3418176 RepID=UPI003EB7C819